MDIQLYKMRELPADLGAIWEQVQQARPELESPCFTLGFAKAVAAVRDDTEVGVLIHDGQAVGFFPFHRGSLGVGQPLGGHLSDFQAVIAFNHARWTLKELIGRCRLTGWDFDHFLAGSEGFESLSKNMTPSPFIDLSSGFMEYEKNRKAAGSNVVKSLVALERKIEREVGPLRFEFHHLDSALFQQMIVWKKEQYKNSGVADTLDKTAVDLLTRIVHTQTERFAGVLSALWAGDKTVAIHMGMRSRTVWHYWFPTYDPAFYRYSPGMLLLLEMMKAAHAHNLKKIDLGKGDADYKTRLMTGATPVLEGSIILSAPVSWARYGWRATKACVRGALRHPGRLVRNWIKPRGNS